MCRELFLLEFSGAEKSREENGEERDASVSRIASPLSNRRSCTRVALFDVAPHIC